MTVDKVMCMTANIVKDTFTVVNTATVTTTEMGTLSTAVTA